MIKEISNILSKIMIENNVIYVLKGFNSVISKINIETKHIFDLNIIEDLENIIRQQREYNKLFNLDYFKLTQSNEPFFCLFEEMKLVEERLNIPLTTEYKIKVINFNCFDYFYPGLICDSNEKCLKLFEIDNENEDSNIIQIIYSEYEIRNNCPIIVYNNFENIESEEIAFIDYYSDDFCTYRQENELPEVLYDNSMPEAFIQIFNNASNGKCNIIKYIAVEEKQNPVVKKYLSILNRFGINIRIETEKKDYNKLPELYYEYLAILKRKNERYDFKNIPMYKDPFRSNELIELNQSIIIDAIYQNIIKAQNKESFKDIFVTAPTGAGKSILFQIPAIMAAEKNNLVTIVISPLIGLMKDQVNNIGDMTNCADTINSEYTPIEKENKKEKIKNGETSIIYISPETLLSNSDIKTYIGERDIGLLVVDEAHTVATWGKNFRPDYWYLGDYIDKLRHSTKYLFPIATFTATATISNGYDDMYHDIVESLNMTCDTFFGNVKRNDIKFNIRIKNKDHAYQEEKELTVLKKLNSFVDSQDKTIVYFPYVKTLNEIYNSLPNKNVGRYYGSLDKYDKDDTLEDIRFGNKNVVLATKAFGMGIDVKDIKNVYHFAPTGNLADYVQEIGRVARDPQMIGIASTDYYEEDFKYINKLYGMSQITNYNIIGVLKKIDEKYKKENKRNFMMSVDEFAHVFKEDDEDNIENRLKATIIAIKKDFKTMNSFVPLIFKPRSMFTKGFFWISNSNYNEIKNIGWDKYLRLMYSKEELKKLLDDNSESIIYNGNIYEFNFKKCWEDHYNGKYDGITFANFKRKFFEDDLIGINKKWFVDKSLLTIECKNSNNFNYTINKIDNFLISLKNVFDDMKINNKHYNISEIAKMISNKNSHFPLNRIKGSVEPMLTLLISYDINKHGFGYKFCEYNKSTDRYHIKNSNYDKDIYEIREQLKNFVSGYENEKVRKKIISIKNDSSQMRSNSLLIGIQIMELLDMITYVFEAGNRPEFFVRVNSPKTIQKVINATDYHSKSLATISSLHYDSVRYMKYFFENLHSDESRWDFIEDYFLGNVESKYNIPNTKINIKKMDLEQEYNIKTEESNNENEITVYVVYNTYENVTNRYYISDIEIEKLKWKNFQKLSKGTALAKKLESSKSNDVFDINGYEYMLEKIEYYNKNFLFWK